VGLVLGCTLFLLGHQRLTPSTTGRLHCVSNLHLRISRWEKGKVGGLPYWVEFVSSKLPALRLAITYLQYKHRDLKCQEEPLQQVCLLFKTNNLNPLVWGLRVFVHQDKHHYAVHTSFALMPYQEGLEQNSIQRFDSPTGASHASVYQVSWSAVLPTQLDAPAQHAHLPADHQGSKSGLQPSGIGLHMHKFSVGWQASFRPASRNPASLSKRRSPHFLDWPPRLATMD